MANTKISQLPTAATLTTADLGVFVQGGVTKQATLATVAALLEPAQQWNQSTPSAQWTIPHSLGRRPNVDVYLTSGEYVITDVTASTTQVVVTFPAPTAGYAVLT